MLGSYLMGLLAASSTLGLATKKAIAILPPGSAWQVLSALHAQHPTPFLSRMT